MAAQPQAGPSRSSKPTKSKKTSQNAPKHSKVKKVSENQRIEALERDAMNYVIPDGLQSFSDLPISEYTKRGLKKAFFVDMTDIQKQSIPVSLKGKDVLGAARTGSGKTLAFLVPVLEILYRRKWGPADGLGALIISPTRELAVQIFEVLRSIGGYHSLSAGLVIGGKKLKDERDRLSKMNILVATPGRLLQHMDQTFGFESDNLQMLVLDEADRILDMGFQRTLSALLSHLPKSRQTLLFSATQTQSVSDLARLSLNDPVSIGLETSGSEDATPQNLEQHYLISPLEQKLSILWGFIKTHLTSKTLVFLSSCKQVRFVYETFCKMHPGISLIHLHGKQKQTARLTMYNKFITSKHAVLLATDIAARGLDFPSVDWVLQLDAPEDADTYIHRVGRTARYQSKGKALLFLLPSEEEGMLVALKKKSLEVAKIKIRTSRTNSIDNQLQNLAFQDPEIKYLGQRAFVSYLRSIYLHKDKSIFKLSEMPVHEFALSLGLPGAPKIKFLKKDLAKQKKNADRDVEAMKQEAKAEAEEEEGSDLDVHPSSDEDDAEDEDDDEVKTTETVPKKPVAVRTKYDRMFERKNQNVLAEHYSKLIDHDAADDDDDDFITLKRTDHDLPEEEVVPLEDVKLDNLSKRKLKLGNAKRKILLNAPPTKKIVFDDLGEAHAAHEVMPADDWIKDKGGMEGVMGESAKYVEGERSRMKVADLVDKEEAREKKREKKRKRKDRENGDKDDGAPMAAMLSEDDGYVSPEFDLPDLSSDNEDFEPPTKRNKASHVDFASHSKSRSGNDTIEDEEALALELLRRRK